MLPLIVVAAVALGAALLTLFSGFGLGTLLLPVFALFLPVELAVAATALVHLANNLFKVALVGRHADRSVALAFGVRAFSRISSRCRPTSLRASCRETGRTTTSVPVARMSHTVSESSN